MAGGGRRHRTAGRIPAGEGPDRAQLRREARWTSLVRPLAVVRPDDDVESTLLYFQREGATVCVVQDHESPVGLVTIEDVLEQVVGRIEDEYPRHPKLALRDLMMTDTDLLNLSSQTSEGAIAEMAARIPATTLPAGGGRGRAGASPASESCRRASAWGWRSRTPRCPGLAAPLSGVRAVRQLGSSSTGSRRTSST